ncbi:ferritin light chain-like [Saccopteryx leptura]|uniref:ferritin light chain-like n=1 Tax=Saccopteryx leptura TaxID=249018 RepID=UPI00339C3AC2
MSVNSILPSNHELPNSSKLFHTGGGPVNRLVILHLQAFCTYLCLGFCFYRDSVGPEGWATSSVSLKGALCLLQMQNQHGSRGHFQDMQKPSRTRNSGRHGNHGVLVKRLTQALLGLHVLSSACTYPHLSDCLESHFLWEQFGDHVARAAPTPGPADPRLRARRAARSGRQGPLWRGSGRQL